MRQTPIDRLMNPNQPTNTVPMTRPALNLMSRLASLGETGAGALARQGLVAPDKPITQADLEAIAKAQAKRERKARRRQGGS